MTVLGFCDLGVRYGDHVAVRSYDDIVHSGEWVCIIGPNGAGKSSVLRAAAGLIDYTGSIAVDQKEIPATSARWRAQHIAFVPQSPLIPLDMTVGDYVLLGRNPYIPYFGVETSNDREIAIDVLGSLDLAGFEQRRLATLSGGELQRLVIARALAQQAPVLLLDEPTSALDIGHQQHALELVDRLRRDRGLAVVSAMHDLTLAGMYADRLVLMHEGRCVAQGSAAEVLRPENLSTYYGVSARVHQEPDGTIVVIPNRGVLN
jgi:iron complex transport system ATP-binding protein